MPRYHFTVLDGVYEPDPKGTELPDWRAARHEAIRRAGAILRNGAKRIALGEDWQMHVTDESGRVRRRTESRVACCALGLEEVASPAVEGGLWMTP